jgi:outer membrane immunogenic protein
MNCGDKGTDISVAAPYFDLAVGGERHMRKLLIGSVAFLGLTAAASAADWRPAPPVAPPFTWTGLYIGANAGGIWSDGSLNESCRGSGGITGLIAGFNLVVSIPCHGALAPTIRDSSSWLAGGQLGYNYQIRSWVFGVEADLQATDLSRSASVFDPNAQPVLNFGQPLPFALTYRASSEIDWFGTVRGRLGITWDRLMIYGTGGAIFANVTTSHFLDRAFAPGSFNFGGLLVPLPSNMTSLGSHDAIVPGWIVGGGVEYAFTNNLSLKAEGMYYELQKTNAGGFEYVNGRTDAVMGFGAAQQTFTEIKHHGFLVRGGVNWRFYGM